MALKSTVFLLILSSFATTEEVCKDGKDCSKEKYFASNNVDTHELLDDLKQKLKSVRKSCVEICETSEDKERVKEGVEVIWSRVLEKQVDCKALFSNPLIDADSQFPNPRAKIPKFLLDDFTYQGRVPVQLRFMNSASSGLGDEAAEMSPELKSKYGEIWTEEGVNALVHQLRRGKEDYFVGMYTEEEVEALDQLLDNPVLSGDVEGKRALVIGSQVPWIEALLIKHKIKVITTMEYNYVKSTHHKITAVTPQELSEMYLEGNMKPFDLVISFSSLEHSGLGRYGDQLNPHGDLITMARAWCLTRSGGRAVIGVPVDSRPSLVFNAHRVYSADITLPHLFANWKHVHTEMDLAKRTNPDCEWCYQPLFVLQKE